MHCDGEMAAVDLRQRFAQVMDATGVKPEPGMLKILTADLTELGIGNLASPKIQAELEPWLDGVELLVLDNLSEFLRPSSGTMTPKAGTRSKNGCYASAAAASRCLLFTTQAKVASGGQEQARRRSRYVNLPAAAKRLPPDGGCAV